MKAFTPGPAFVAAAALAGALVFALVPALQAASPADGQPAAPGTMDHGGAATLDHSNPDEQMRAMMQHHEQMMACMHAQQMQGGAPLLPGQDAFGAIQEIVRVLESDPKTDWSKVDLEALRQHLIDMNEVALKAEATAKPVDGGLEIAVTGSGRTLAAIQRIIPAHAEEIDGFNGWSAKSDPLSGGVRLTVTSNRPKEVQHIRGLGFVGILVSGSHHQPHHLAMAKGEFEHSGGNEHSGRAH